MGVSRHRNGRADRSGIGRLTAAVIGVAMVAVIGACSSSATLSTLGSAVGDGTQSQPERAAQPEPAASAAAAAPDAQSGGGQTDLQSSDGYSAPVPRDDLKIVYTGSLQLVVDNLQTALAKAKTAVEATGGYIGASQESNDGDKSVATITYRIPATRWEDAIGSLRGLASKVVSEQTQASEVGGQLVDLDARIRNLQASEASLQEIAKGTGKISDLLQVEAQLTDVRGQIEQLQGQQAQLTDQVAYGTLVTTFGLEVQQVQATAKGWDPAGEVDSATATLIGIGQTLGSAAIWFGIVWLPVILVFAVLAVIALRVIRRFLPEMRPAEPIKGWDRA